MTELERENARLRETLNLYANPDNWIYHECPGAYEFYLEHADSTRPWRIAAEAKDGEEG